MIDLLDPRVDRYRDHAASRQLGAVGEAAHYGGLFTIPTAGVRRGIRVIVSRGDFPLKRTGWDHLSASTPVRCPTWEEMCRLKDLFFGPDERTFQLHPLESENISNHRYCLHMWRPVDVEFPTPPSIMVGVKELGELQHRR